MYSQVAAGMAWKGAVLMNDAGGETHHQRDGVCEKGSKVMKTKTTIITERKKDKRTNKSKSLDIHMMVFDRVKNG